MSRAHKFIIPRKTYKVIITVVALKDGTYALYWSNTHVFYFNEHIEMPAPNQIIYSEKELVSEMVYFLFGENYVVKI
jgi:hypothetical protein